MKRKSGIISAIMLVITSALMSGQNSQVLYYMNLPQNHLLNPALRPSNSLSIGLPGISGIDLNISNNFLNYSDLIVEGRTDSLISFIHPDFDADKFLAGLKDKNSLEPDIMVQLFNIGFNAGKNYIFFDINEHVEANMVFPRDMFEIAFRPPESMLGKSIDLSALSVNFKYYREAGLGFSRNFTDRLRIGVKAKMLFGIATASMENNALNIHVNQDYSRTVEGDVALRISGPIKTDNTRSIDSLGIDDDFIRNSPFDLFSGSGNIGFGIDLGATYKISERIFVSAALTDLGFINWKQRIMRIEARNNFNVSPINLSDVINKEATFDEFAEGMADSLKNSIKISDNIDPFTTFVPAGLTLGGSFNLNRSISLGVLSYSRFIGSQVKEALTFSANVNLRNLLSASLAYTASSHRYDNLGAGLSLRAGVFQFYVLTDRIPLRWKRIKSDNFDMVLPENWNNINMRLGMNLTFGNRVKKKNDVPMMVVD